jgi:hypothetical protein
VGRVDDRGRYVIPLGHGGSRGASGHRDHAAIDLEDLAMTLSAVSARKEDGGVDRFLWLVPGARRGAARYLRSKAATIRCLRRAAGEIEKLPWSEWADPPTGM